METLLPSDQHQALLKAAPTYFNTYINLVPEGNILDLLTQQKKNFRAFMAIVPEEKGHYRYAPEKWTVNEVLGHIIDTERIFAYRALSFARGEQQALPGYDENEYATSSNYNDREWSSIQQEWLNLRTSNLDMFHSFQPAHLQETGTASGKTFSVYVLLYILMGHVLHHQSVIQNRYLI